MLFRHAGKRLSGTFDKVGAPGLVIWGTEDNTVPLRDAGVVADEWPEADLRFIPKAGHWPHLRPPKSLAGSWPLIWGCHC